MSASFMRSRVDEHRGHERGEHRVGGHGLMNMKRVNIDGVNVKMRNMESMQFCS